MNSPIRVRHSAVVLQSPPRSRVERAYVVEAASTIRLPEAGRGEFEAIGTLQRYEARGDFGQRVTDPLAKRRMLRTDLAQRLFSRGGAIWTVLRTDPDEGTRLGGMRTLNSLEPYSWRAIKASELQAFLVGEAVDPEVEGGIRRACLRSPIAVPQATREQVARGHAGFREGRIAHDGRDTAAADLQSWLDRNLAIVGGEVRVRSPEPLMVHSDTDGNSHVLETMPCGAGIGMPQAYVPEEGNTYDGGRSVRRQMQAGLTLEAIRARVHRDAVLAYFANVAPDYVLARARAARGMDMGRYFGGVACLDERSGGLRMAQARGKTGSLGALDAEAVAKAVLHLAEPIDSAVRYDGLGDIAKVGTYVELYLMPLTNAAPDLDADLADIEGLAP